MLVCGVEVDMEALYQKYKEQKVKMIAEVRQLSGAGLKEAKEAVDIFWAQKNGIPAENGDISSESGKESSSDGALMQMVGANGILTLYKDRVTIKRRGIRGALGHGFFQGEKEIMLSSITAIQLKKAGFMTVGYIQFSILGGVEARRGLNEAVEDENTVTFDSGQTKTAEAIKNKIYELQNQARTVGNGGGIVQNIVNEVSGADELLKYKQLLDAGVLTQEEFDRKKQDILFGGK